MVDKIENGFPSDPEKLRAVIEAGLGLVANSGSKVPVDPHTRFKVGMFVSRELVPYPVADQDEIARISSQLQADPPVRTDFPEGRIGDLMYQADSNPAAVEYGKRVEAHSQAVTEEMKRLGYI